MGGSGAKRPEAAAAGAACGNLPRPPGLRARERLLADVPATGCPAAGCVAAGWAPAADPPAGSLPAGCAPAGCVAADGPAGVSSCPAAGEVPDPPAGRGPGKGPGRGNAWRSGLAGWAMAWLRSIRGAAQPTTTPRLSTPEARLVIRAHPPGPRPRPTAKRSTNFCGSCSTSGAAGRRSARRLVQRTGRRARVRGGTKARQDQEHRRNITALDWIQLLSWHGASDEWVASPLWRH